MYEGLVGGRTQSAIHALSLFIIVKNTFTNQTIDTVTHAYCHKGKQDIADTLLQHNPQLMVQIQPDTTRSSPIMNYEPLQLGAE